MTRTSATSKRLATAAGWGAVATLTMSLVMLIGVGTGVSPMPEPIPVALVTHAVGTLPQPAILALALLSHLAYGAVAAVVLAAVLSRVTVWIGAGYGLVLWALMGALWLPYVGWGPFGTAITAKVALATLLLHLVYGGTLGMLLDRHTHTGTRQAAAHT